MKRLIVSLGVALGVLAAGAAEAVAATITFEGAPSITTLEGAYVEAGFRYETVDGGLYVNDRGNPGNSMDGLSFVGGGMLAISALDGALFTFIGLDYAAYSTTDEGLQTLLVRGARDGAVVASQEFVLANDDNGDFGAYDNWTTEVADSFGGVNLDQLLITLNGSSYPGFQSYQAIDNVVLSGSAVPEPASWAMIILGCGLAGAELRRRRVSEV